MAHKPVDTFVATVLPANAQKSVLILTADNTQDLEFFYPYYRFIEEGYNVDVVTPKGGEFKAKNGEGLKETKSFADIDPSGYQLLYIPGGKAPEELKKHEEALEIARNFANSGKPIAAICHGPQVLAAAGLIEGVNIAAWPEVQKEIEKAGANYVDAPTVIDGQFITARWPGDLPSHLAHTLQILRGEQSKKPLKSVGRG